MEHWRCVDQFLDFLLGIEGVNFNFGNFCWAWKVCLSDPGFFCGAWNVCLFNPGFFWEAWKVYLLRSISEFFVEHGRYLYRLLDFYWEFNVCLFIFEFFPEVWKVCLSNPGFFVDHGAYVCRILDFLLSIEDVPIDRWIFLWNMEGVPTKFWIFYGAWHVWRSTSELLTEHERLVHRTLDLFENVRCVDRLLNFLLTWKMCLSTPGFFVEHRRCSHRFLKCFWSIKDVYHAKT